MTLSYMKAEEYIRNDGLKTIGDCLKFYGENAGDQEAIVFASIDDKGPRQAVTFKELYDMSCRVARGLIAKGVRKGECVMVTLAPSPGWLYLVFGSILAGAKVALSTFRRTDGSDIISTMKVMQSCAFLAVDPGENNGNLNILKRVIEGTNKNGTVRCLKVPFLQYLIGYNLLSSEQEDISALTIEDLIAGNHDDVVLPALHEDDVAVLMQTSGSTGSPKLVAHTHKSLLFVRKWLDYDFFSEHTTIYNDRPFYWTTGFPHSVIVGQKRVTLFGCGHETDDSLRKMIQVITEEKCTVAFLLPPVLVHLLKRQDELSEHWPLRAMYCGGQPLTNALRDGFNKVFKVLKSAYGSTELTAISSRGVYDENSYVEYCVGKPVAGSGWEIKIVDQNDVIVPVNTRGEIYVKGPGMFKEYYNDPERTSMAIDVDGWYKTDDLGTVNEDGELFVLGRKSNMILSAGSNIVPESIEREIKTVQGIEDVVIVPVPDPVDYQVLCACVIAKKGYSFTAETLRRYCEELYSDEPKNRVFIPKFYIILDKFPVTNIGKLCRKDLEQMALGICKDSS